MFTVVNGEIYYTDTNIALPAIGQAALGFVHEEPVNAIHGEGGRFECRLLDHLFHLTDGHFHNFNQLSFLCQASPGVDFHLVGDLGVKQVDPLSGSAYAAGNVLDLLYTLEGDVVTALLKDLHSSDLAWTLGLVHDPSAQLQGDAVLTDVDVFELFIDLVFISVGALGNGVSNQASRSELLDQDE